MSCHFLLQGIFATQGSNPGLPTLQADSLLREPQGKPKNMDPGSGLTLKYQSLHLILGREVITNLDSLLKSRDITLPIKVHLVKAMIFPVVMYGCESWTIKKAERRRIEAFFFFFS